MCFIFPPVYDIPLMASLVALLY
jgi:hypothetical protein